MCTISIEKNYRKSSVDHRNIWIKSLLRFAVFQKTPKGVRMELNFFVLTEQSKTGIHLSTHNSRYSSQRSYFTVIWVSASGLHFTHFTLSLPLLWFIVNTNARRPGMESHTVRMLHHVVQIPPK